MFVKKGWLCRFERFFVLLFSSTSRIMSPFAKTKNQPGFITIPGRPERWDRSGLRGDRVLPRPISSTIDAAPDTVAPKSRTASFVWFGSCESAPIPIMNTLSCRSCQAQIDRIVEPAKKVTICKKLGLYSRLFL